MWNYRVIAVKDQETEEINFVIKEVYYSQDGTIFAMMENESAPFGESRGELKKDMRAMMKAFDKPTLKEWEVEFHPHERD